MSKFNQSPVRGFSLVELVIVIVIIGIIAAIAIPRVSRGSRGADEAALRSDLATMRSAIEYYASEHGGVFPGAKAAGGSYGGEGSEEAFKSQLLFYTDAEGNCSNAKDQTHLFGPYLRKSLPPLPVGKNRGNSRVNTSNTDPQVAVDDGTGWVYCYATGEIIANSDDNDSSDKLTYDQY
jgi:general secretion pathway protein G